MDGRILVGLGTAELERLATEKDVLKVSRRDLSWALADRRTGATTVSATMWAARMAGIDVFATGGIGGVHRGVTGTFDVSADLTELASTSVCVVSAGAKAILDIPKTLEVLETLGVPVLGFGTSEFPAFYSRGSGLPIPLRVESAAQIARIVRMQRSLGAPQGILVANPVQEDSEIPRADHRWMDRDGAARPFGARRQWKGRHTVPAVAHRGAFRRQGAGNEREAVPQQRAPGLRDRCWQ